jgi:hypothetical protein
MARQQTSLQTLRSIAGSALAGPGILVLFLNLEGAAAQLSHHRGGVFGEGFGLLHLVMLAASFDHQQLVRSLLQMLVSFWPVLLVISGTVLLRDAFPAQEPSRCIRRYVGQSE